MKIAKINILNGVNSVSKAQNTTTKISFGEYTTDGGSSERPWLKGHMYDLVMYRPHKNIFNIENRSKKGQYSRFLLNPKEEKYNKLVIMMKPTSKVETKSGLWFYIATQRSEDAYKSKVKDGKIENLTKLGEEEKFISKEGELAAASKLFSPLNPKKEIKDNPRVHEDKNGNITYDRQTRRLLQKFAEENNLEIKNTVAYMAE